MTQNIFMTENTTENTSSTEYDFELPELEESTPPAVRKVHISDETCEACGS